MSAQPLKSIARVRAIEARQAHLLFSMCTFFRCRAATLRAHRMIEASQSLILSKGTRQAPGRDRVPTILWSMVLEIYLDL
ncbi:hypothetical protein AKI39_21340 [Bordetella sp. H567]|nr:hypothetical protein AKI39_21340 [Bordetella sp. H567]